MSSSSKTQCNLHQFWPLLLKVLRAQRQSAPPTASLSLEGLTESPVLKRFASELWFAVLELLDFETKL